MHEKRNFITIVALVVVGAWMIVALFILPPDAPAMLFQKIASVLLTAGLAGWLVYALGFEDKLPNHLAEEVGDVYYGVDGLAFMPAVRVRDGQALLCVYYQNRFENPVQGIVHLRPPDDSFVIQPGASDVHFSFKVGGGDYGVIHQPIAVPGHIQGEVIEVYLAAASYYPRSHGSRLRKAAGMPCGTLPVDWGGAAFKTGVHEVSGEILLKNPTRIHLAMPKNVASGFDMAQTWRQECLQPGKTELAITG